jgi:uncharacterized protein (DUF302 family)
MARWTRRVVGWGLVVGLVLGTSGCGTLRAAANLEQGAGAEAVRMWSRWVDSEGDIAVATTWSVRVAPGVTVEQIEQALASTAAEYNLRAVGELSPARDLPVPAGQRIRFLKVYSYCSPTVALRMLEFSPAMAAYLPCRITVMEREDGLWLYTLNMDMMTRMGRRMPAELRAETGRVRDGIRAMLDRGAAGEF